ncbi:AmmeMemoRadiSam system protein A [bacterium]|nr:AmmeMemoRadiSam system protein A [bacterium]
MNDYLKLAKLAVEEFVKQGRIVRPPKDIPQSLLKKKSGVFVSIYNRGKLRGCVGTYLPTKDNIAEEIISSAVSAAQDPRFPPLKKEELSYLSYEVYILHPPQPVKSIEELNPQKYGILVKSLDYPFKSGLLLPGLKDIKTKEEQIIIACQKAGIDLEKEKIIIFKFEAEKYGQQKK